MANQNLRLKELFAKKGMTIAEVAEQMGIKAQSLSQALYRGNLSSDSLAKIADVLGVTIPELYEDFEVVLQKRMTELLSGVWKQGDREINITIQ